MQLLNQAQLLSITQQKIRSRQLPPRRGGLTWACEARGGICSLCDQAIRIGEPEYQWLARSTANVTLRFHRVCYQLWSVTTAPREVAINGFRKR